MMDEMQSPETATEYWLLDGDPRPVPFRGLINRSWYVGEPPTAVLQWVSPLIDLRANLDIAAVTDRLAAAGVTTPRLIPTPNDGLLFVPGRDRDEGCWRALTYIPGRTVETVETLEQAENIGALVGRFHAALSGWCYEYQAPPRNAHDTDQRMTSLRRALRSARHRHPLVSEAHELGDQILARWAELERPGPRRQRNCHGDLKVSNIRLSDVDEALALIDLDTVGLMEIDSEMGDAWRSWCSTGKEDDPSSVGFDIDIFAASARGWLEHARFIDRDERRALVPSIERISLELAARFCTDSLENVYFWEDRQKFPVPGTHNLLRSQSQLLLADRARSSRHECEDIFRSFAT